MEQWEPAIEATSIAIPLPDYEDKLANLVKILLDLEETTQCDSHKNEINKPPFDKGAA
jgi:hypothetical protein